MAAQTTAQRRRALKGYNKSLLGNVLTRHGPITDDDGDGYSVAFAYDATYLTFQTSVTRGADPGDPGLVTQLSYAGCPAGFDPPPGLGLPCQVTDPRSQSDTFSYDALGRVVQIDYRTGLIERRSYTLPGPTRITITSL